MWTRKILPFATFFAVAHPETFKFVRKFAGDWVASADGLPTTYGLLLHALVFVILVHFLWVLLYGPKRRSSGYMASDISTGKAMLAF